MVMWVEVNGRLKRVSMGNVVFVAHITLSGKGTH